MTFNEAFAMLQTLSTKDVRYTLAFYTSRLDHYTVNATLAEKAEAAAVIRAAKIILADRESETA